MEHPPAGNAVAPAQTDTAVGQDKGAKFLAALTRQIDASASPSAVIRQAAMLVLQYVSGLSLRWWLGSPRWQEVAAACVILATAVVAVPALLRRAGKAEPLWAAAAALHEQSLSGRVPAGTLAVALEAKTALAAEARCTAAYLYVPGCTREGRPHFGACCFGGSIPLGGRLLLIIGEHMAAEPAQVVEAVLAHERGHVAGWRMYAHALTRIAGTWGLAVVAWSVPSAAVAAVACAVLVAAAKGLMWLVELSCDRLSARQTCPGAVTGALDFKDRTFGAARARRPAWLRWPLLALECVTGFDHPPSSIRRAALTRLGG